MNNLDQMSLGRTKIHQISISENVNQKKIEKILLENISLFENFLKKENDKSGQEVFDYLKKNKKLNFSINKQIELFIINNRKNIIKIIKYIIFRYKFNPWKKIYFLM